MVVCIDLGRAGASAAFAREVEGLTACLRSLAHERALGDYDGSDTFASESHLYFRSDEPGRLVAAVTHAVARLAWRDRIRVRVSSCS